MTAEKIRTVDQGPGDVLRGGQATPGGWRPAELPPGDYIVRIFAADYAGNVAADRRDLPVAVR